MNPVCSVPQSGMIVPRAVFFLSLAREGIEVRVIDDELALDSFHTFVTLLTAVKSISNPWAIL
jgi:hypothetical protein